MKKIYAVSKLGNSWHVHLYDGASDQIHTVQTDMLHEDDALSFALLKAERDRPSEVREILGNGELRFVAQFDVKQDPSIERLSSDARTAFTSGYSTTRPR